METLIYPWEALYRSLLQYCVEVKVQGGIATGRPWTTSQILGISNDGRKCPVPLGPRQQFGLEEAGMSTQDSNLTAENFIHMLHMIR